MHSNDVSNSLQRFLALRFFNVTSMADLPRLCHPIGDSHLLEDSSRLSAFVSSLNVFYHFMGFTLCLCIAGKQQWILNRFAAASSPESYLGLFERYLPCVDIEHITLLCADIKDFIPSVEESELDWRPLQPETPACAYSQKLKLRKQ